MRHYFWNKNNFSGTISGIREKTSERTRLQKYYFLISPNEFLLQKVDY
jgi:hypothetical protein